MMEDDEIRGMGGAMRKSKIGRCMDREVEENGGNGIHLADG